MKRLLSIICIAILFTSCYDIIEEDLSPYDLEVLAPQDDDTLTQTSITFWWEPMKGADYYRMQIVSPSFDQPQYLLLDSNVKTYIFTQNLNPGTYQWRIRGENSTSYTDYQTFDLVIDSVEGLTGEYLTLVSPSPTDLLITNEHRQQFQWSKIYLAEEYRFQVLEEGSGSVLYETTTTEDTISYTFDEGTFVWQVRAEESSGTSTYYNSRTITVDTTSPLVPLLEAPINGDTVSADSITYQLELSWQYDTESIGDSVEVYSDSLITLHAAAYSTGNGTYDFQGDSLVSYYWRVKSFDNAGNESPWSEVGKFYLE